VQREFTAATYYDLVANPPPKSISKQNVQMYFDASGR
jgi:hypothetical protein